MADELSEDSSDLGKVKKLEPLTSGPASIVKEAISDASPTKIITAPFRAAKEISEEKAIPAIQRSRSVVGTGPIEGARELAGIEMAGVKMLSWRDKLDKLVEANSQSFEDIAREIFPESEGGRQRMAMIPRAAAAATIDAGTEMIRKASEFIPRDLNELVIAEATGRAGSYLFKKGMSAIAEFHPLPVLKALTTRAELDSINSRYLDLANSLHSRIKEAFPFEPANEEMIAFKNRADQEMVKDLFNRAAKFEVNSRLGFTRMTPSKLPGLTPESAPIALPEDVQGAVRLTPEPFETKPNPPITPKETAETVLSAMFHAPRASESAALFPRAYGAIVGETKIPQNALARVEALRTEINGRLGRPLDTPIHPADFHALVSTGKLSFISLSELDKALFQNEAVREGLPLASHELLYQDSVAAAQRPIESVALHNMEQAAKAVPPGGKPPTASEGVPAIPPEETRHPVTGKLPHEMTSQEFVKAVESGAESPQAIDIHRQFVEKAAEAGKPIPHEVLQSLEEPRDISIGPSDEGLSAPNILSKMSPEQFKKSFPNAPQEIHKKEVLEAFKKGEPVHEKSLEAYAEAKEIAENQSRDLQERNQREISERKSSTPVLDALRRIGLNLQELQRHGFRSDVENLKRLGIFRVNSGVSLSEAAKSLHAEGVIPEHSEQLLIDMADAEARIELKKSVSSASEGTAGEARKVGAQSRTPSQPSPSSLSIAQNLQRLGETEKARTLRLSKLFPSPSEPLPERITDHPDFVKITHDASSVVFKYAMERGSKPTPEFAKSLFNELHDAFAMVRNAAPETKKEIAEEVLSIYPDISAEWLALNGRMWSSDPVGFELKVKGKIGDVRPVAATEAEALEPKSVGAAAGGREIKQNASQFKQSIKDNNLKQGSIITAKRKIGDFPAGTKGRVIDFDMANANALVSFDDKSFVVSGLDLVETSPSAAESPIPVKKQIEQIVGLSPEGKTVHLSDIQALKEQLKNMSKGALIGRREGIRIGTAKMKAEWSDKLDDILDRQKNMKTLEREADKSAAQFREKIKSEMLDHIREMFPPEARGKFLSLIKNAGSMRSLEDYFEAFDKIDDEYSKYYKKSLIGDIKKLSDRITDSPTIDSRLKSEIGRFMDSVTSKEPGPEFKLSVEKMDSMLSELEKLGTKSEIPRALLDELRILGQRNLKDLKEADLETIHENLRKIEQMGRAIVNIRDFWKQERKDAIARSVLADLKPISSRPLGKRLPGDKISGMQGLKNYVTNKMNGASILRISLDPMDVVFSRLSKTPGYDGAVHQEFMGRMHAAYNAKMFNQDFWQDKIQKAVIEAELKMEDFELMAVYAESFQPGGKDVVKETVRDQFKKESEFEKWWSAIPSRITPGMKNAMAVFNEYTQARFPKIQEFMREKYNKEVNPIKGTYFPRTVDRDSRYEKSMAEQLLNSYDYTDNNPNSQFYTKQVKKGFTIERVPGLKYKVKLSWYDSAISHIRQVEHLLNVQGPLLDLFEIANTPEIREGMGDIGHRTVRDWLDLIARDGGTPDSLMKGWLNVGRRNLSYAQIPFRLPTALVHATKFLYSIPELGFSYQAKGLANAADSRWIEFINANSSAMRNRSGPELEIKKIKEPNIIQTIANIGYIPLRQAESWSARSAWIGFYLKKLESTGGSHSFDKFDSKAGEYADLWMRRTHDSPDHLYLPPILATGGDVIEKDWARALFQFQLMTLNRWSQITNDMEGEGIASKFVNPKNWLHVGMTIAAAGANAGLRVGIPYLEFLLIAGLAGTMPLFDFRRRQKFSNKFFEELSRNVPGLPQMQQLGNPNSNIIPFLSIFNELYHGSRDLVEKNNKATAIGMAVRGIASLSGFPGVSLATEFYRMWTDDRTAFPYHDELLRLHRHKKSGNLTNDDAERLQTLEGANRDFSKSVKAIKELLAKGNQEQAQRVSDTLRKKLEKIK